MCTIQCRHQRQPLRPQPPTSAPSQNQPGIGSSGVGDEYYPGLGNGGYDAQHYDVRLKVDPDSNEVKGSTVMDAVATQDLSQFNLDFRGLKVDSVTVNGKPARFVRQDAELTIIPESALSQGQEFNVAVGYHGQPQAAPSMAGEFLVGWKNNGQGITVDSQPDGAQTWHPTNDHPLDKATYSMRVEVPKPLVVAANGTLMQVDEHEHTRTYHWQTREPLAPYLATMNVGEFVEDTSTSPEGVPIRNYFPPHLADKARVDFGRTGEMMSHFSKLFGPYPYENYGVVVVSDPNAVSGAMETQTMSLFEPGVITGDRRYESLVAHELAHHWFGNLVSVQQWKDLWLHEGFASYCEWLWIEQSQGVNALDKHADRVHQRVSSQPGVTIGAPPQDNLFHSHVYQKGALALHALRREVGDESFFGGVRTYLADHAGEGEKNPTIADFQAIMENSAGRPLGDFFHNWLYTTSVPAIPKTEEQAAA